MSVLTRDLGNNQSMLFDKENRVLYLIEGNLPCADVRSAEDLVSAGRAKKYNKDQLGTLQSAFSAIVLLGAGS